MPPEPAFGEDDTGRMEVGEDRPEPERLTGAVLDSLASHIAVLDESGTILAVNESWRQFARANGADERAVSAGVNYLRICDEARGEGAGVAAAFAAGIRDVLAGRRGRSSWNTRVMPRTGGTGSSGARPAYDGTDRRASWSRTRK